MYRPLLSPAVTSGELAAYLRMTLQDARIDVLRFDAMDPAHASFDILEAAIHQAGLKPYRFFCFGNWYLPVQGRSYQTYFQGLASQVRNTVRRREKKFFAAERGRLEIVTGNDGLEEAVAAWRKIYGSSWKIAEPFPEFVPGLIRLCAARGWLRLGLAYHDGEPVAGQIWIVSHGRAAIYKLAYDEKFAYLSAGTVLTAHLMRHVLDEDKVQEVDYLIGDDAYKKDWMSHRRERWGIIAYNTKTAWGLAGAATQTLSEMSRQLGIPKTRTLGQKAPMMKWALYPVSDFSRHVEAWDALNQSGCNSPLLNSRFVLPSLRHFQTGGEKLAILGDPDHPDAMCILERRSNLIWDTFQPAQAPVGFWLMRPGLELETVISALIRALPGFPLALGITQQDPALTPRPPDSVRMATIDYINTARILVEGGYEDYWNARGKNLRQNMRKVQNKLEKDGLKYQLKCISDSAQVKGAIESYGRLESAGWKAADGTAVQSGNVQGNFYTDMLEAFCLAGCGRIYYLTFNDAIVAMDLCIYQGDTIIILKTSYDEAYREYSPAMLMHQELFRELFQTGDFHLIEFYGKVMDWHLRWTEDIRTMYHVNVYRWEKIRNIAAQSNKSELRMTD
jgi:CelD/BcsL family acetyltransferase involved in cellulose biosynthesis